MTSKPDEIRPEKKPKLANDEERDEDFISALPNKILHIILSKLQIRDAAVTTVVSKRWAPLFPTLPSLEIDASSFNPRNSYLNGGRYNSYVEDSTEWIEALFSVLDSRRAPIKKFDIAVEMLNPNENDFYEVFRDICAAGVEELSIMDNDDEYDYEIPPPIFSCKTITKLEIRYCRLEVPSKLTGLHSVNSLQLSRVKVADDDLRRMISRCKALEKLIITDCHKVKNIVIRAPNLLELAIELTRPVAIVLKSVPRLTSVKVSFYYSSDDDESIGGFSSGDDEETFEGTNEALNLISFLNGLCGVKDLRLDFWNEYRMILSKEGMTLPTRLSPKCCLIELKKLCLHLPMNYHTFNMIISCLLNSSPHLKEVIICVDSLVPEYKYCPKDLDLNFWEKQLPAECVKHHLTTATFYLDEYISEDCFAFPRFLLQNSGNLKSMNILFYDSEPETISKTEEIKNEVLAIQMASPDVEIKINHVNWRRYTKF